MKFIDIGVNLTDLKYTGVYNGKTKHEADLDRVLDRSFSHGLTKMIVTGGSLSESTEALKLAQKSPNLYCTVGCHPTRCSEFVSDPDSYLDQLKKLVLPNRDKVVAIGECGLDYDRLDFCPKEVQKTYFAKQLQLYEDVKMPFFFHCRNAHEDFLQITQEAKHRMGSLPGVVHSFDGDHESLVKLLDMGFYIGINGCSLKTEENLKVAAAIPSDRLLLETDSPWCEVRPTHAGHKHVQTTFPMVKAEKWSPEALVKGRNEPVNIIQVFEILCAIRQEDKTTFADTILNNTMRLFFHQ